MLRHRKGVCNMTAVTADKFSMREVTRFGTLPETVSFKIREPGSALTHFAGLILMSIGAGPLLMKTRASGSASAFFGMLVFVLTSCMLYMASTTYHTVVRNEKVTTIFRKIDHMSISVMIAGTYTPVCLTALRDTVGIPLLLAVWILALGGILLKALWITCPKWVSSAVYVAMGWLCVFAMAPIKAALPAGAFAWLLAGGIAYTVGAAVYAMHPKKFDARHIYFGSHEIFHVFIMIGTFCHYMVMFRYLA